MTRESRQRHRLIEHLDEVDEETRYRLWKSAEARQLTWPRLCRRCGREYRPEAKRRNWRTCIGCRKAPARRGGLDKPIALRGTATRHLRVIATRPRRLPRIENKNGPANRRAVLRSCLRCGRRRRGTMRQPLEHLLSKRKPSILGHRRLAAIAPCEEERSRNLLNRPQIHPSIGWKSFEQQSVPRTASFNVAPTSIGRIGGSENTRDENDLRFVDVAAVV